MAAKKVTIEKETDQVIIFKACKPMSRIEFNLLSDLVRSEEEKAGLKIILMPYSCEVGD